MRTQTYELQHPLHQVPSVATQTGYYRQNGRAVGLELQFCDGHRASLTYDEIEQLRQATQEPEIATITIDRRAFDYTMSLVRAGVEVVTDHRIKRDRAMEIVAEHSAGPRAGRDPDFDRTRPLTWTWSVEVVD